MEAVDVDVALSCRHFMGGSMGVALLLPELVSAASSEGDCREDSDKPTTILTARFMGTSSSSFSLLCFKESKGEGKAGVALFSADEEAAANSLISFSNSCCGFSLMVGWFMVCIV